MIGAPLGRQSINQLVLATPPLLEDYLCLSEQLQPNGFDLTLRDVASPTSSGGMGRSAEERQLAEVAPLDFDQDGWLELEPGPYLITFNEVVNLTLDLMALGRPRSSLLRSGVSIHTAVWDAGYRGRSQSLLTVHNPWGYRLQRGARLLQLVFFRLDQPATEGYQGQFMGENV